MVAYVTATQLVESMNSITEQDIAAVSELADDLGERRNPDDEDEMSDADITANLVDRQGATHYTAYQLADSLWQPRFPPTPMSLSSRHPEGPFSVDGNINSPTQDTMFVEK